VCDFASAHTKPQHTHRQRGMHDSYCGIAHTLTLSCCLVSLLQERDVCCHRDCPTCDTLISAYMDGKYLFECSPDRIQRNTAADHQVQTCDHSVAPCQLSKQVNKADVYQARWWRHVSYIINKWYFTLVKTLQQQAIMCTTLIITTTAAIVGTLVIRPALRNRILQLSQQWKVRV
jgi:hypothetical protein